MVDCMTFNSTIIKPLFSSFADITTLDFQGILKDKVLVFTCHGAQVMIDEVLVITSIRETEKSFWQSCQDLLKDCFAEAQLQIRGKYTFQLISCEIQQGLGSFQWRELSQLLVNHSRKLAVGETRFIQYCSLFGLLTQQAPGEWGKLVLQHPVIVFKKEEYQLDLFIKRMLKLRQERQTRARVIFYDLSRTSILNPNNHDQQTRLQRMLQRDPSSSEVFVVHQSGCSDLSAQFFISENKSSMQ